MSILMSLRWYGLSAGLAVALPIHVVWLMQDEPVRTGGDLETRVAQLESRISELETILFANLQINVLEAERRVAESKQRVLASRELFFKGLLSEFQFQQDQFELDRAELELEMLRDPHHLRTAMSEIELRDAERRLEEARYRARFSESLLLRGYITPAEVDRLKQAVERSEQQLELARQKLDAIRRLEGNQEAADKE